MSRLKFQMHFEIGIRTVPKPEVRKVGTCTKDLSICKCEKVECPQEIATNITKNSKRESGSSNAYSVTAHQKFYSARVCTGARVLGVCMC